MVTDFDTFSLLMKKKGLSSTFKSPQCIFPSSWEKKRLCRHQIILMLKLLCDSGTFTCQDAPTQTPPQNTVYVCYTSMCTEAKKVMLFVKLRLCNPLSLGVQLQIAAVVIIIYFNI